MLVLIVLFACVSAFLFGYDLGLIGGALLHIQREFHTSTGAEEAIVGAAKLGAVAGTFLGGALMLHYGRRPAIALDSIFFAVGPLLMAAGWNVACLVVGRFIVGIGIGVSAVVVPAYLGEVAPARVRGRVVEMYEVMLCVGMLASALADAALNNATGSWRWMVGLPIVPAAVMAFAFCALPESPRWLITTGNLDAALAVIHKIYTSSVLPAGVQNSTAEVEAELMDLWSAVEKDKFAVGERRQRHAATRHRTSGLFTRYLGTVRGAGNGGQGTELGMSGQGSKGRWQRVGAADGEIGELGEGNQRQEDEQSDDVDVTRHVPRVKTRSVGDEAELLTQEEPRSDQFNHHSSSGGSRIQQQQDSDGEPELDSPSSPPAVTYDGHASQAPRGALEIGTHQPQQQQGRQQQGEAVGFWRTAYEMILDVAIVGQGPEKRAFRMALILAFFNQAFASTAIINYAPKVLQRAGVQSDAAATLFSSFIGASKLLGVGAALFLVDSIGRRPLLIYGSLGCSLSLALLVPADWAASQSMLLLGMCAFIFAFSISWAGVFWVLLSEMFSMGAKSPAAAAATAVLFLTGAVADLSFLSLHDWLGHFSFLVYSLIALVGAGYVAVYVPETKGRTLQEVQQLLQGQRVWGTEEGEALAPDDSGGL